MGLENLLTLRKSWENKETPWETFIENQEHCFRIEFPLLEVENICNLPFYNELCFWLRLFRKSF